MDKQTLRECVWDDLEASGEARFPFPPHGRIPNFAGADEAAERLTQTDDWKATRVIKSNPDAPQRPVRLRALEAGKTVYMAVPRLREEKCFLKLDPAEIEDINHATTIGGSSEVGEQVGPDEMEPIDLIVAGSVAVTADGRRIGKGEGYSDLEYAVLAESGRVSAESSVATTVHERQVVDDAPDADPHDVPLDLIVTPRGILHTGSSVPRPAGLDWSLLDEERIDAMPVLGELRPDDVGR